MSVKTIILFVILSITSLIAVYIYFLPNDGNNNKDDFILIEERKDNDVYTRDFEKKNFQLKSFKSEGNTLVCEALDNITGNKSTNNFEFKTKEGSFTVDCYDKLANVAIDYKDKNNYTYEENNQHTQNILDFYMRAFLSSIKTEKLKDLGVDYFKVPYIVDTCQKLGDELNCENKTTNGVRKNRIENYIRESIIAY